MKKTIAIIVLALLSSTLMAQTKSPKRHIFYDTVKTVKERIEYAPDTIPVYFKEIIIANKSDNKMADWGTIGQILGDTIVYEMWNKGFVVWQTYIKYQPIVFGISDSTFFVRESDLYKEPYEPSKSLPGVFLYENKTQCKNLVIYSIKR